MSEFYALRRASIKDMTGLIAFIIGWFASAPFAWPYIKAGFDAGDPTKGVFRFIVVVFGGAIVAGLVGLALGWTAGFVWERIHRRRRPHERAIDTPDAQGAAAGAVGTPKRARVAPPALRYDGADVSAAAYLQLVNRIAPGNFDEQRAAAALGRTINIGAWDGARLVGVARVLSDGYFFAALADLIVDPDMQRKGVGRELMNRAFEKTPRGMLFCGAPIGSSAFFDHIGCERGPTGFTMRRAAK